MVQNKTEGPEGRIREMLFVKIVENMGFKEKFGGLDETSSLYAAMPAPAKQQQTML